MNFDPSLFSPSLSPLPVHCGAPAYVIVASADVYTASAVVTNWQLLLNESVCVCVRERACVSFSQFSLHPSLSFTPSLSLSQVQSSGTFTASTNGPFNFGSITFTSKGLNSVSLLLTPNKSPSPPANATLLFDASGSGCV